MTCYRYLINIAYKGRPYRGLQIQQTGSPETDNTVQNIIQKKLRSALQYPSLTTTVSSRTDKGVHALSSYLQFTLPLGSTLDNGQILQPPDCEKLAQRINRILKYQDESIRVLKIQQVPSSFHCRYSALSRSYVYRLAVARNEDIVKQTFMDSEELQWIRDPVFNTSKFIKAAELFTGRKQFRLYMKRDRSNRSVGTTIRSVIVHLRRGNSLSNEHCGESAEFWDVHITSKAFMRKQVREMVGGMINVARGINSLEDLKTKLKGNVSQKPKCPMGSRAHGLTLKSIVYNSEDLAFKEDEADEFLSETCVFEGPQFEKHAPVKNVYWKMSEKKIQTNKCEDRTKHEQYKDKDNVLYQDDIKQNDYHICQQTKTINDILTFVRTVIQRFKKKS